jgi:glycosyltransferase involved in cell wall biosynthesis
MKLLIDCMPLHSGGGVQVATAFLDGLLRQPDVDWLAVAPLTVAPLIPKHLLAVSHRWRFHAKAGIVDILRASFSLQKIESALSPDVVFTIFGPAYFRAKAPHLVGFALPNLIYDRPQHLAQTASMKTIAADGIRRHLVRKADHIVVETETVRGLLKSRMSIPADRISVIGNSVNPLLTKAPARPSPKDPPFAILIPSAYYPHKNLEVVPAVAAALARRAPALAVEFRLTLPAQSTHWQAIACDAAARGVKAQVITLGALDFDQLITAYHAASAVFLPTLREASTAVYPESFHFRRPLITSDLEFAHELCGDAALFVPPRDPEAIASQIERLAQHQHLRETLTARGAARLETSYPSAEDKFAQQMSLLAEIAQAG